MHNTRRSTLSLLVATLFVCLLTWSAVKGQTPTKAEVQGSVSNPEADTVAPPAPPKPVSDAERISALEESLRQQAAKLDELQKLLLEQQQIIQSLGAKPPTGESGVVQDKLTAHASETVVATSGVQTGPPTSQIDERLKKVEKGIADIGPVRFSGDIRLRSESFFGLTNVLANADNPALFGNDLSYRHRMRVRARLGVRGAIGDEFEWGLRLATGSFAENISTNQTLTDFFNRKPFGLDQAFITYKPRKVPGLRIQGGKFEPAWAFTEMTIDQDMMVEGINETYSRYFKSSIFKELTLAAWQLPFVERNSAFVRNASGGIDIDQTRRGGRDLSLFGGQLRTRIEPNDKVALSLYLADQYFSGTQFISPVQVFGNLLQLPVIVNLPATATTPAQVVTTQVSIPRDVLVSGNLNLGLTNFSNNATNRDGRLSSGFNLVDLLARLELKHSKRFPVTVLLNFVTNTQAHDVVTAGAGGADLLLPNHENNGFWGEVQVGQTRARGDLYFSYAFMRIEKDAVLTPFNFSDVTQQSDMRGHRLVFAYAADPRVTFSVTGIVTQRLNGLFGPFVPTPLGSLNRDTTRLQIDTIFRF